MRLVSLTFAIAAVVALTGCSNLRARSTPAKACLTNPCGVSGPCQQSCAPAQQAPMQYRQLEK